MRLKRTSNDIVVGLFVPSDSDDTCFRPAVSRGEVLSGVLSGTCGYDSIPIVTDSPAGPNEPDIDYDPSSDQRLDRFDAVEMGIAAIDEKTPVRLPSGTIESDSEKKE